MGYTLAQPGEDDRTVHVQQRCGFMSIYFDHLLKVATYNQRENTEKTQMNPQTKRFDNSDI